MFEEAPLELIQEVYVSESWFAKNGETQKLRATGYEIVSDHVFGKMTDTKTPQGILAVVRFLQYSIEDFWKEKAPMLILLEDLQDPGNLGTILRTAEGAGAAGVIMSKGCVDIYNPKVIRSTMGSIYRVPFLYVEDFAETVQSLQKHDICVYAAHLKGEKSYDEFSFEKGTAFMIGNEGNGLKEETAQLADEYLLIPMAGKVESLNAAIATSVLAFEAARQRRQ